MDTSYAAVAITVDLRGPTNTLVRDLLSRVRWVLTFGIVWLTAFLVLGNAVILSFHLWARETSTAAAVTAPVGIENFVAIDDVVWRGSRPTEAGYRSLAARGVTTIIDLRAESFVSIDAALMAELDITVVSIPLRDGQAPTEAEVETFLSAIRSSTGKVFVHCMAGVGRTGSMIAAYLVNVKGMSPFDALRQNLAVGPPSLEQIAFVAGGIDKANPVVTGMSRVLDAPRRLFSYIH